VRDIERRNVVSIYLNYSIKTYDWIINQYNYKFGNISNQLLQFLWSRADKLNFIAGHISITVALKGPVVTLRLYKYTYIK